MTRTAVRIHYLMGLALEAVSPSPVVSSHVKAEVLSLLRDLRDAEVLRLVGEEARTSLQGPPPKHEPLPDEAKR